LERSYGGLAKRVEGVPTSTTNLDCVFARCRRSMVRAIIRDATNDKKIRFSFIRVIPPQSSNFVAAKDWDLKHQLCQITPFSKSMVRI